jgi:hypothetical protein
MSKYDPLGKYLRSQPFSEVPMSFGDIERVTGVPLPPKAQAHRAWWSNSPSNNVMTKVWLDAGFRSEQVDMAGRRLVFKRVRPILPTPSAPSTPSSDGLSDPQRGFKAEKVLGVKRHSIIGALKGLITVEAGFDLAQPAMPEWAGMLDDKYGREKSQ